MMSMADGDALLAWMQANPGAQVRINNATSRVLNNDWQDLVASGSSRGPNGDADLLKPDISAPGEQPCRAILLTTTAWPSASNPARACPRRRFPAPRPGLAAAPRLDPRTSAHGADQHLQTPAGQRRIAPAIHAVRHGRGPDLDLGRRALAAGACAASTRRRWPRTPAWACAGNRTIATKWPWRPPGRRRFLRHRRFFAVGRSGPGDAESWRERQFHRHGGFAIGHGWAWCSFGWVLWSGGRQRRPRRDSPRGVWPIRTDNVLALAKNVDQSAALVQDILTYTIDVANTDISDRFILTDALPANTSSMWTAPPRRRSAAERASPHSPTIPFRTR